MFIEVINISTQLSLISDTCWRVVFDHQHVTVKWNDYDLSVFLVDVIKWFEEEQKCTHKYSWFSTWMTIRLWEEIFQRNFILKFIRFMYKEILFPGKKSINYWWAPMNNRHKIFIISFYFFLYSNKFSNYSMEIHQIFRQVNWISNIFFFTYHLQKIRNEISKIYFTKNLNKLINLTEEYD